MHSISAQNECEIMQAEEILKIIRDNSKYFVSGYFSEAMSKGVKTLYHLRELSNIEAKQVAKAVFEKLASEQLAGI